MAGKPAGFLQGPAVVETDRPMCFALLELTGLSPTEKRGIETEPVLKHSVTF